MSVSVYRPIERFHPKHGLFCRCERITEKADIVVVILKNHTRQYRLRCSHCQGETLFNIPQLKLSEYEKDHADILRDNRDQKPCARCGDFGGEEHHTAPRVAFDDAEEWPIIRLCLQCHARWHATMDAYYRERFAP